MDNNTVAELFKECDVHNRNYLELLDLHRACPQLSMDELRYIFDQLDINKDGKVTKDEFVFGFVKALHAGETAGFSGIHRRASVVLSDDVQQMLSNNDSKRPSHSVAVPTSPVKDAGAGEEGGGGGGTTRVSHRKQHKQQMSEIPTLVYNFEPSANIDVIPCQDDVLSLYQQLQKSGVPSLLSQFEKVIAGVCKEIEEQKHHNENLQTIYHKERERYSRQMNEVENELDQQMLAAQEKIRREERERMEREKEAMRQDLESEILELQANIRRLQKVESVLAENGDKAQKVLEMKTKLQDLSKENRSLKTSLTEKKTEMALIKGKLARLRQEYDEKCMDLESEKDNLFGYLKEKENLERQLQLLYGYYFSEANKQLHDANDNLRTTLESRHAFVRQCNLRTPSPVHSLGGSSVSHSRQTSLSSVASSRSSLPPENHFRSVLARPNQLCIPKSTKSKRSLKGSSFDTDDDVDSGMVTRESDTACSGDSSALEDENYKRMRLQQQFSSVDIGGESDVETLEMDSVSVQGDRASSYEESPLTPSRIFNSKPVFEKKPLKASISSLGGSPDRTFRVVMAGDSAVGKSSLVMRMVKDKFMPTLQSTLGVDFHVKSMNVDGRNVAIQLWDTAGQERFRSLCKSYFRRADGAILVYDCTCEHSFLNVRNWMQTIQESAQKIIPVLLCGNKVDIRITLAAEGKRCVQKEDGEKLAKTYNAVFVETSAKEGTNVNFAAYELARHMLLAEDCEVRSTLTLSSPNAEPKKSSTCSCK